MHSGLYRNQIVKTEGDEGLYFVVDVLQGLITETAVLKGVHGNEIDKRVPIERLTPSRLLFNDKIEPFVEIINKGLPELFKDTAIDEIKEKIEAFVKENLIDPIKTFLIDKVKSILGEVVLSSIAAWYTWAKNSFEGAKFIIDTLDPVLDAL